MDKKELSKAIAEKLDIFHQDPTKRCVDSEGECFYSGKSLGKDKSYGCMVGVFLSEEDRITADELLTNDYTGVHTLCKLHEHINIPDFICDNAGLFSDFQNLHDSGKYWNNTKGLSLAGENKLERIIHLYGLDPEPFQKFLNPKNSKSYV